MTQGRKGDAVSLLRGLMAVLTTICMFSAVIVLCGCSRMQYKGTSVTTERLIEQTAEGGDMQRLLFVVDSLTENGDIRMGESYFWQGYANYRMGNRALSEFYWGESVRVTSTSDDPSDIAYYARSASFLAGQYCRYGEYAIALQTTLPVTLRLQKIHCDTTSNYYNLLIFTGCSKVYFDVEDSTGVQMLEEAYQKHLNHIKRQPTKSSYNEALAGLVNITYIYTYGKEYRKALQWSERIGQLVKEFKSRFNDEEKHTDKQWGRYLIFRTIALEGLGRYAEAEACFKEYGQTQFSKSMEGITNATDYYTVAERWDDAAECYNTITNSLKANGAMYSLDNIHRYLLKKYQANKMLHNTDSTNAVARDICELLDSAIQHSRRIDSEGLMSIQKKNVEILEAEAKSVRHRQYNAIFVLGVLLIIFSVYTVIRLRSQRQLEEKNRQLVIANAQAEESSKMKTDFIQQISHEIRTPLNILSGFTQIITTSDIQLDAATQKEINQKIIENTDRITGLVNKMLELSDANSQTVIERTDNVLAVQIAAEAAESSGITLVQHVAFDIALSESAEQTMLHTNQQQAVRALSLLLDNAQKFLRQPGQESSDGQKGNVALSVSTTSKPAMAVFTVEDTGIGVPAEEAEHIFDEFVQLNEFYDGTGIGLTVSRSIARRLGGDVVLDTTYSGGARFVMTLPMEG